MTYRKVRDIMPELLAATENGKLQWKANDAEDDFFAMIEGIKVEIELKDEGEGYGTAIALYVWNENHKIIDSDLIYPRDKDFSEFRSYFSFIRQSAFNVSGVLNRIVNALK